VKITGTLRTYPAGAPAAAGMVVELIRESDDVVLDDTTTDADGEFAFTLNGHPGPWRWEGTDTAPATDVVRATSSLSYGSGGAYSLWELVYALRALGNGVVAGYANELEVTYDGAGLDLDVATGATVIKGIPVGFPAVTDYTLVTARDATHPKACYLVVETVGAGEVTEGLTRILDVCGAAAASPALPALTQTEALYQLPLASFTLPNTGSTTLTNLADLRTYTLARNPTLTSTVRRSDPTLELTTTSTAGANATGLTTTVTLLNGVVYDLEARAYLQAKISSVAETAQLAIYLNDTPNMSSFVTTSRTDLTGLTNTHLLSAVTGTGAAISCGVRIKVSAGTMTYSVGYLQVIARPRS
jgi:hypothetical protein